MKICAKNLCPSFAPRLVDSILVGVLLIDATSARVQKLLQESFSKRPWQLKQYQRRCNKGIGSNRAAQVTAPPKTKSSTHDGGTSCFICLEEGPNESGQPLRRDCSCRGGSAGFAHLFCIVEYAQGKSRGAVRVEDFAQPWMVCLHCKQSYENELALDLVNDFVTFAEEEYPADRSRHLEALVIKLGVLVRLVELHPKQKEQAEQIASRILSVTEQMRTERYSLTRHIQSFEPRVYYLLGLVALREETEESARTAVGYFEKNRDSNKAVGDAEGVAIAENLIAHAKSRYEESTKESLEMQLEHNQTLYNHCVGKYGEDSTVTLEVGAWYAIALENDNKVVKAERLLKKLADAYRRVCGPDHRLTKQAELQLRYCKKLRCVLVVTNEHQDEWKYFRALRHEEDGKKCIVQGPLAKPRSSQEEVEEESTISVGTENVIYLGCNPIVCHGLADSSSHLNGKLGELTSFDSGTGLYRVRFEDEDLNPCSVHHDHVRILFELPIE